MTKKPKVIAYSELVQPALDYISESCELIAFPKLDEETYPRFLQELEDAEGLVGFGLKVDEELLAKAPKLKVVSNFSVGYDNLDLPVLTKHKVMATNTPEVLNDTVADLMFGLMLAVGRRIAEMDQYVKTGQWERNVTTDQYSTDIHHKTLGIIGMGEIGSQIAKRASLGFDMNVLYHNRSRNEGAERLYQAQYCELDELLGQSDFVCLMTPLTMQTEKMMGEREFSLMKKTAIFVNGSRGRTVDEAALISALQKGEILGAGLDVFEVEPVSRDNPLLSMKNVITLPHIGSATHETRMKMAMLAAENVVQGVTGQVPSCLLNKEALER